MAEYIDLHAASSNPELLARVKVAITVAIVAIRDMAQGSEPPNHAQRLTWSRKALENPMNMARQMLPIMLAEKKDSDISVLDDLLDDQIQTAVEKTIDLLAG